jgi:hypothetical protein
VVAAWLADCGCGFDAGGTEIPIRHPDAVRRVQTHLGAVMAAASVETVSASEGVSGGEEESALDPAGG